MKIKYRKISKFTLLWTMVLILVLVKVNFALALSLPKDTYCLMLAQAAVFGRKHKVFNKGSRDQANQIWNELGRKEITDSEMVMLWTVIGYKGIEIGYETDSVIPIGKLENTVVEYCMEKLGNK